jgi:hypothetical protein
MPYTSEHTDLSPSLSAWDEAERYGIDMRGLLANLNKTVLDRIRNHDRALTLALALQRAMTDRHGRFRTSSGTAD